MINIFLIFLFFLKKFHILKHVISRLGKMVHASTPSIWEANTEGLQVQSQSGLHSELKV